MASENIFDRLDEDIGQETQHDRSDVYRRIFIYWVVLPLKTIWSNWRTRIGFLLIAAYLVMGTVGVFLLDAPRMNEGTPLLSPMENPQFILGTNNWGIDLWKQAVHATPVMLQMAVAGGLFMTIIAVLVGTLAGYKRGTTEKVLMTLTDIQISIPGLPLLMVLAIALQPENPILVGILLSVDGWPNLARSLHSQVLSLREESYVEASRTMGLSTNSIVRDDLLPNIMPYILIHFMQNTIAIIHTSVALYFLGVLPFSSTNWGVMLNQAFYGISFSTLSGWHWLVVPIVLIQGLSFAVILVAQGMDRLFNPRVRARIIEERTDES